MSTILPIGFEKSLKCQHFPRVTTVMSSMNGKAGAVSTIMAVCLALVAAMKAIARRYMYQRRSRRGPRL